MAKDGKAAESNDKGARSFAVLLSGLGDGAFHAELSEEMQAFMKKLEAHAYDFSKAKGTFTITLGVEIDRDGVVTVDPDLKVKTPKPARKRGRYWITPSGHLSPENPKQQQLPLAAVPAPKPAVAVPEQEAAPMRGV